MKNIRYSKAFILWVMGFVLVCYNLSFTKDNQKNRHAGASWVVSDGFSMDFEFSHDEMLNFNIEEYIQKHAPHLLPHAETISHFAGKEVISPRLLIAIMEQQSKSLSVNIAEQRLPFGKLSSKEGFIEQTRDLTEKLSSALYISDGVHFLKVSPQQALEKIMAEHDISQLGSIYRRLFPGVQSPERIYDLEQPLDSIDLKIQFPWAIGTSWRYGGVHTGSGSGTTPRNCLDFSKGGEGWGDNITENVVASSSGSFVRHSSCNARVILDDTWSTTYYHMDHLKFTTNDKVSRNEPIGKYANNLDQALCNGGHSGGPHVHWCLQQNRRALELEGVVLSGWTIHPGEGNYDADCSRMYMTRDGEKHCPRRPHLNEGVPNITGVPQPDNSSLLKFNFSSSKLDLYGEGPHRFTLYGLDGQVLHSGHGKGRATYKISGTKPGVYILHLFNQNRLYKQKLTILD